MVQVIQAQDITLDQLTELFSLTITYKDQFFAEWLDNLPELTDLDKQQLDRVKGNYISLVNRYPLSENSGCSALARFSRFLPITL